MAFTIAGVPFLGRRASRLPSVWLSTQHFLAFEAWVEMAPHVALTEEAGVDYPLPRLLPDQPLELRFCP